MTSQHAAEHTVPRAGSLDKRLVLGAIALATVVLGSFFAYRYLAPTKQIESIAVMPFVNESGNAEVEYLLDGMTETLINSLSQLPKLSGEDEQQLAKTPTVDPDAYQLYLQGRLNFPLGPYRGQWPLTSMIAWAKSRGAS